ncbi:hypothetical protein [Microbacterium sp. 77mftsu3.1]|uniref:hypothetical protein n=1 Tax=Microbacterium sp. 77mftsu3.1 TaxID=1761802 RepID=UPI00035F7D4C|nr:hypothetical protein [Microbacterium sp. 77mftsu3.1]SDH40351.1 hypothetical protein SAMN04488590_3252 [Microbacterium sp. 77mftsu3.1]
MTLTPVDLLPFDARVERLDELAGYLRETLLDHDGQMPLRAFLDTAAREHRLPMAEVKYGLTRAKGLGTISVTGAGIVALA